MLLGAGAMLLRSPRRERVRGGIQQKSSGDNAKGLGYMYSGGQMRRILNYAPVRRRSPPFFTMLHGLLSAKPSASGCEVSAFGLAGYSTCITSDGADAVDLVFVVHTVHSRRACVVSPLSLSLSLLSVSFSRLRSLLML